jgi:hypothetical protein
LELTTHLAFGVTAGLVLFGRVEAALLVGLGALLPDLDREYWFVKTKVYQDEQPHRARFHNVFIMAIGYLLSPFFSLGIFLHALQDSFTTSKDRGCEWFYPISRWVKRGRYNANGEEQLPDPNEHVYFYQEDPKGLIEYADPDLREPPGPSPWRRVYGPALNSQLLDRGFLFGSITLAIIWLLAPDFSHLAIFSKPLAFYYPYVAGYLFFGFIYWAGELDRRDRAKPLKILPFKMLQERNLLKKPLFIVGLGFFAAWLTLYRIEIWANLETVFSNWILILLGILGLTLVSLIIVKLKTRKDKTAIV